MGGNFVYARDEPAGPVILFAGEAQNLLVSAQEHWDRAVREHGANGLYTRLNISEAVRRREHADIASGRDLLMGEAQG
jgi:hypothetical protein